MCDPKRVEKIYFNILPSEPLPLSLVVRTLNSPDQTFEHLEMLAL